MSGMRYTAVLIPEQEAISVFVPAMPGCNTMGRTREEALRNVQEAIGLWVESEMEQGRGPLEETPGVVMDGVRGALEIIEEMRQGGEVPADRGYELELVTVDAPHPVLA